MKKNPIGKYLLQNWYYYVFAFGSMALSVFLDMLAPLVTLHIVDDVLVSHKMELLWKYLAAFLLIGAAKALFQYIKEFLFDVSSVRVASQMRDNLFRHVQRLSVEYFDKNNTGELLARVRALCRRSDTYVPGVLTAGDLKLDRTAPSPAPLTPSKERRRARAWRTGWRESPRARWTRPNRASS